MEKQSIEEVKALAKLGRKIEHKIIKGSTGIKYYLQYADGLEFSEIIMSQPKALDQDKTDVMKMTKEDKANRRAFYKAMTMFFVRKPKITEYTTEKTLGWNDVPIKDKTILENAIVRMMGTTPEQLAEDIKRIEIFRDNAFGKSNKHPVSKNRQASKRVVLSTTSHEKNHIRSENLA